MIGVALPGRKLFGKGTRPDVATTAIARMARKAAPTVLAGHNQPSPFAGFREFLYLVLDQASLEST